MMISRMAPALGPWVWMEWLRARALGAFGLAVIVSLGTLRALAAEAQNPSANAAAVAAAAAVEAGWHPATKYPVLPPEAALRTIEVPAGYRLQCVASEPMVQDPVMIAFDGNGALYVCEWRTYM